MRFRFLSCLLVGVITAAGFSQKNARVEVLLSAQTIDEKAKVAILRAGEDIEEAAESYGYHLFLSPQFSCAIHESLLNRQRFEDRLALMSTLSKGLLNADGAFSLAALNERDRKTALDVLKGAFPAEIVDRLEQANGWVFLTPPPTMLLSNNSGKQIQVPLPIRISDFDSQKEYSNEGVLTSSTDSVDKVVAGPDPFSGGLLDSAKIDFLYPYTSLSRKHELINFAVDKLIKELEEQSEKAKEAWEKTISEAYKESSSALQALSKGGRVSDMPEEMRLAFESSVVNSYQRLGFASEAEARAFLSNASFKPVQNESFFAIVERHKNKDGQVSLFRSTRPANLHRAG